MIIYKFNFRIIDNILICQRKKFEVNIQINQTIYSLLYGVSFVHYPSPYIDLKKLQFTSFDGNSSVCQSWYILSFIIVCRTDSVVANHMFQDITVNTLLLSCLVLK